MKTLHVALGARSYSVHIGPSLLGRSELLDAALAGEDVLIVTNETLAPLYLDVVKAAFVDRRVSSKILPDGESHKTLGVLNTVFDALLEGRYSRDCTLVALGGGVVGDITGFAAATYQRGVGLLQLPTTLLAQVDSSVGGKTAVNHTLGKNMIGAFHQPLCVIADTDTLRTLPDRELRAGLAEVVKYGLICAPGFFEWVESNVPALLDRDPEALAHAIEQSCRTKADIVSADEREAGRRALLNLGHTFGHAIEIGLGLGEWLHGEAVAAGLCLAADLSHRLGWLPREDRERIRELLERIGLPTLAPVAIEPERLRALMQVDKKVAGGKLRLVLLEKLGRAVLTKDFDEQALGATLRACRDRGAGGGAAHE